MTYPDHTVASQEEAQNILVSVTHTPAGPIQAALTTSLWPSLDTSQGEGDLSAEGSRVTYKPPSEEARLLGALGDGSPPGAGAKYAAGWGLAALLTLWELCCPGRSFPAGFTNFASESQDGKANTSPQSKQVPGPGRTGERARGPGGTSDLEAPLVGPAACASFSPGTLHRSHLWSPHRVAVRAAVTANRKGPQRRPAPAVAHTPTCSGPWRSSWSRLGGTLL